MSFQSWNDFKRGNTEATVDPGDSAATHLLGADNNRMPDAVLIAAIWGLPQASQTRRLIKATHERKR